MDRRVTASLLAPLTGDFGAESALMLMLVGAACGAVGVWVLNFAQAILAESFSHALLPGLVLAALLGGGLLLGALLGVVAAYFVIVGATRSPRTTHQTGISVAVSTLLSGGVLLAAVGGDGRGMEFEALLFGDPLAATGREVALAAVFFCAVVASLVVFGRRFAALAFDPGAAPALGVNPARTSAVALAMLAISVTVAANVAGTLLALALVTGPAYGAVVVCRRLGAVTLVAALAGACSALAGIYLSWYADWPVAASIALVICCWALGAGALGVLRDRVFGAARRDPLGARLG
jgi:ABC-type Mn2+/Zn2+ transport system permease subunit